MCFGDVRLEEDPSAVLVGPGLVAPVLGVGSRMLFCVEERVECLYAVQDCWCCGAFLGVVLWMLAPPMDPL